MKYLILSENIIETAIKILNKKKIKKMEINGDRLVVEFLENIKLKNGKTLCKKISSIEKIDLVDEME
jgi:hypothetical protein